MVLMSKQAAEKPAIRSSHSGMMGLRASSPNKLIEPIGTIAQMLPLNSFLAASIDSGKIHI